MSREINAVASLATIMSFRLLGLFMILPIFSVYAIHLTGANAALIGFALGAYGLTQALLQIPFGMLSDKINRKWIITLGLILFGIGSIMAACASSIYMMIIARALQGGGAVGSTILALLSDLTCDENRTKAMAFIGMSIGIAFAIAMIIGPFTAHYFGLSGVFWFTAVLAVIGIAMLYFWVPEAPKNPHNQVQGINSKAFSKVLKNKNLVILNISIMCLHAILTALFLAIPIILTKQLQLTSMHQSILYLSVLLLSFIAMIPLVIIAEKKHRIKQIFLSSVFILGVASFFMFHFSYSIPVICCAMWFFFTAFNTLEALLPSLVSKIAPLESKGTAFGIYSSSQFFGIFLGGTLGGVLSHHFHIEAIFDFIGIITIIWWVIAAGMSQLPYVSTIIISLKQLADTPMMQSLLSHSGIMDIAMIAEEKLLYVKIDKKNISEYELRNILQQSNLT